MWLGIRWLLALLLRPGGVPDHVAFIMDGNRRFAADRSMQKMEGHTKGYAKMVEAIHWCLEIGVQYISVYAFSIDNFARSLEEVSALMHLAETKYEELTQESGLAERMGVEVRVLGDLSLAPRNVQASAARLMRKTAALPVKHAVLNICFSYSSREETIHSLDFINEGLQQGIVQHEDVSSQLFVRCLRTQSCPPVDLLVRTSGETRLSDFLLWQSAHAQLHWVRCMWPDWSYLSFIGCVISWQQHQQHQQQLLEASQRRMHGRHSSVAAAHTSADKHKSRHRQADAQAAGMQPELRSRMPSRTQPAVHVMADGRSSFNGSYSTCQDAAQVSEHSFMWQLPSNWAPHELPPAMQPVVQALQACTRLCACLTGSFASTARKLQAVAGQVVTQMFAAVAAQLSMVSPSVSSVGHAGCCHDVPLDITCSGNGTRTAAVSTPWSSLHTPLQPASSIASAKHPHCDICVHCSCLQLHAGSETLQPQSQVQCSSDAYASTCADLPCCGASDASSWTPSTDGASLSMPTSPADSAPHSPPHSPRAAIATVEGTQVLHQPSIQAVCTACPSSCDQGLQQQLPTHDDEAYRLLQHPLQLQEPLLLQHAQPQAHEQQQGPGHVSNLPGNITQQQDEACCEVHLDVDSNKKAACVAAQDRKARISSLLSRQQHLHDAWVARYATAL